VPGHVDRLLTPTVLLELKLNSFAFIEDLGPLILNLRPMDEDLAAAIVAADESIALAGIEPLHVTNDPAILSILLSTRRAKLRLNHASIGGHAALLLHAKQELPLTLTALYQLICELHLSLRQR